MRERVVERSEVTIWTSWTDIKDLIDALQARVAALETGLTMAAIAVANGDSCDKIVGDLMRLLGKDIVR